MEFFFELIIAAFLVIGGIFGIVGSFGLIKLNDRMSRLHAPTKATTLGVGGVLLASMAHAAFFEKYVSIHELMITLFLFLTAPITRISLPRCTSIGMTRLTACQSRARTRSGQPTRSPKTK